MAEGNEESEGSLGFSLPSFRLFLVENLWILGCAGCVIATTEGTYASKR